MDNIVKKYYDLTPIKIKKWELVGEYMVKFEEDLNGFSIFKVHSIKTQEIFLIGINGSLDIATFDDSDLEINHPEDFQIINCLLLDYIHNKC